MIHRHENGRVAIWATIRYMIACWFPFWDGDAPGRAYAPREKAVKFPPCAGRCKTLHEKASSQPGGE